MKEKIRVALLGASGRMGQCITRLAASSDSLEIVARVDVRDDELEPPVISDWSQAPDFDVLVDFSTPAATTAALEVVANRCCAWLVATTGLSPDLRTQILALASKCPIFIASNTSLGIALMQRLAAQAAAMLADWDCEILETHHHHKVDAPSGTALTLAHTVADVHRQMGRHPEIVTDRSALHEKRNPASIGVASLRGGTVAGEHAVIWFGQNERFELKHTAENREIFAHGALKIASWLSKQNPGTYSMAQMLDDMM